MRDDAPRTGFLARRWQDSVPAARVFFVVGSVLFALDLVATILAAVGLLDWRPLLVAMLLCTPIYWIGFLVAAIVGRRQGIDAAVERGRAWDAEHGEDGSHPSE